MLAHGSEAAHPLSRAIYHVVNRGTRLRLTPTTRARREAIFLHDRDGGLFLDETLGGMCQKTGWQVHAHGLTRNHFQLRMPLAWIA